MHRCQSARTTFSHGALPQLGRHQSQGTAVMIDADRHASVAVLKGKLHMPSGLDLVRLRLLAPDDRGH